MDAKLIIAALFLCYPVVAQGLRPLPSVMQSMHNLTLQPGFTEALAKIKASRRPLVFDVGFLDGKDTGKYVKQGFSVIGVEANPLLVTEAKQRLASLEEDGSLFIVSAGISDKVSEELLFWTNEAHPVYSSFEKSKACTGPCKPNQVPLLRCEALWLFGRPEYLKVDIEERHHVCIRCLIEMPQHMLPTYISWEMHEHAEAKPYPIVDTELIVMMYNLGYTNMKIVPQSNGGETSGWPEDVLHIDKQPNWQPVQAILTTGLRSQRAVDGGWVDFVMKLSY